MAKKEVVKKIKLQIPAGKATPAPPVGTVLGPAGINLQEFCTKYNDATRDKMGDILPVEISIYDDRSFDFRLGYVPSIISPLISYKLEDKRNKVHAIIKNVKLDAIDECKIEIRVFIDIAKKKKAI